jgi:HD superfamily phosphohydrolase
MAGEIEPSEGLLEAQRRLLDFESRHGNHIADPNEEELRGDSEMYIALPLSDLAGWIYEKDDIFKAFMSLPVGRLAQVKQLSFLAYIGPSPETQYLHEFTHTRLEHTLLAAKAMEAILRRNGASEQEVKLGIIAAIMHDQATPAFGEATKKIDRDNLDEEKHWAEVMDEKAWNYLAGEGITGEQIDDIIHNRGLLGKVLDIADRISYVLLDAHQLITLSNLDAIISNAEQAGYRAEIAEIVRTDTNLGSIYKDVAIDWQEGEVYFRNAERLSKFLELRALLNKNLYVHPVSQARDLMVTQALRPYYSTDESDETKLTPDKLRRMSDDDVMLFVSQHDSGFEKSVYKAVGPSFAPYFAFVNWYPQYWERFTTPNELENRRRELEADSRLAINGATRVDRFNPATEWKILDDEGRRLPFREYDPQCAGRIERIADAVEGYLLFWQDKDRKIEMDFSGRFDVPPEV